MVYLTFFKQEKYLHEKEHKEGLRLLEYAIKEEYGIEKLPKIEKGIHGKPYFIEGGPYFNISHTKGIAVCALGEIEVGIDVGQIRGISESMEKRVLSKEEREWVSGKEREEAFIRLWTLKESYVKATGQGLTMNFSKISFQFLNNKKDGQILCNQKGYCFYQQKIGTDAYLALCLKTTEIPEEMKKLHILF